MRKDNCWEFKKCGKDKSKDCPAVTKNAGKVCWMVSGTVCNDAKQGNFLEKADYCRKCDYFSYMNPFASPKQL